MFQIEHPDQYEVYEELYQEMQLYFNHESEEIENAA